MSNSTRDIGTGPSGSRQQPVVMCRNYQTSFGDGFASMQIMVPASYIKEDVEDLRQWLKLIDRQLARMEAQGT